MSPLGQYSEHRRPTAVPKVDRVKREDAQGEEELKVRKSFEQAIEKTTGKPAHKKSFADALRRKK